MNLWQRILSWIVPSLLHRFTCFVCGVIADLTYDAAIAIGWKTTSKGWCCPACDGSKTEPL